MGFILFFSLLKVDGNNPLVGVISMGMLAPRKFFKKRKKVEHFKDEANQKSWRRLMKEIEDTGSASTVLRRQRTNDQSLPKDLVLGTFVRFKQMNNGTMLVRYLLLMRCML